jgi:hypothetical protein
LDDFSEYPRIKLCFPYYRIGQAVFWPSQVWLALSCFFPIVICHQHTSLFEHLATDCQSSGITDNPSIAELPALPKPLGRPGKGREGEGEQGAEHKGHEKPKDEHQQH